MVSMAGEWSFHTTLEVEVEVAGVAVVTVEVVVVVLEVLIWSASSVVSLVILHVNAVCVAVQEDVEAVVLEDIAGAQVMVEGATVLVLVPHDAAACHLVGAAIAGHLHHIVRVRNCHMLTVTEQENVSPEAGVEYCRLVNFMEWETEIKFV